MERSNTPLEEQEIIDLYNDFRQLKQFLEDLTGLLWDNTELPENLRNQIEELYAKKF